MVPKVGSNENKSNGRYFQDDHQTYDNQLTYRQIDAQVSSIWGHFNPQKLRGNLLHSDWLKFEMERSDWSCAYCR